MLVSTLSFPVTKLKEKTMMLLKKKKNQLITGLGVKLQSSSATWLYELGDILKRISFFLCKMGVFLAAASTQKSTIVK